MQVLRVLAALFKDRKKVFAQPNSSAYITVAAGDTKPKKHVVSTRKSVLFLFVLLCLSFCIPFVTLISWWARVYRPDHLEMWRSAPIGGSFSQIGAKTIDFATSVFIAPIVMASINYVWFQWARIVSANEMPNSQTAVPLASVLELSTTSAGSYDLVKMWRILQAYRLRYTSMAALVLLSAISTSLFVNFIAYEAFPSSEGFENSANSSLRYLSDPVISSINVSLGATAGMGDFGELSESTLSTEYTTLLHSVYFGDYKNDSGQAWTRVTPEFVTANATKDSLDKVDDQIEQLWDVPGYRQTISCQPAKIQNFTIDDVNMAGFDKRVYMRSLVELPDRKNVSTMETYLRGDITELDGNIENQRILALLYDKDYSKYNPRMLLVSGYIVRWLESQPLPNPSTIQTKFGNVSCTNARQADVVAGAQRAVRKIELCSIACEVQQQSGLVNLTVSSNKVWSILSHNFNGSQETTASPLAPLQAGIDYRPPSQYKTISGAAGAIGNFNSTEIYDLDTFANKLLYTSAKLQSTVYNIALSSNENRKIAAATYPLSGMHSVLKYRITYIPGILLLGLLSLIISAALVLSMSLYSWKSLSVRNGRVVDGLQFVTDFAAAVQDDVALADVEKWNRKDLEEWGKSVKLRYTVVRGDKRIRLCRENDYSGE